LVAVIVVLVGAVGYFVFVKKSIPAIQQTQTPTSQTPTPKIVTQSISNIFQSESGGCSNIFVYKTNKDNTTGISVSANKDKLKLSTAQKTFNIEGIDGLEVELLMGQDIKSLYCNDALDLYQPKPKKLLGKSGKVIITISDVDESQPVWNRNYTATVILKDVHFVEENGNNSDVIIDELIFKDVRVGWLPG
jgi:hypothetical protein